MSNYLRDVLGADNSSSEFAQPQGLVADVGPDIPGGEGANKGAWREQLRDRLGQFAKMFGMVLFDIEIEGLGRITGHGELVEIVRPQVGLVRIKNHPILSDIDIEIPADNLEAIDAVIPDADFERATGKTLPKSKSTELKDSITGDEALQKIYGQMGLHAKKSGRFAVGRSVKDVRAAAKETYKPVYEKLKVEYPELVSEFPDYESYWDYASSSLAAGVFTRWADSVDDIPELTKASNKIYAREILGLKEDGMIEFYRNSINHKSSEELAGAGYASLDRRMAWDYNSYLIKYEDNGLTENDGRYTVRAKPDEVTGLLGISGAEDEYGVVIGLDVTSQPGRVTRVGDLEMQQVAPWSNDIQTFDRSGGGSPFRRVSPASQFEVFATETPVPGENYSDFYEAFNLDKESRPIPTKWDEMFGEGSFDALNGDYPGYRSIQRLFIDAGDGKVGLDMMELDQISSRDSQDPQANDTYDKTLKMLSVIQELSGKTFMVHRGHNPDDPRLDGVKDEEPAVEKKPESELDKIQPKLQYSDEEEEEEESELTEEEVEKLALGNYSVNLYKYINKYLREGKEGIVDSDPFTSNPFYVDQIVQYSEAIKKAFNKDSNVIPEDTTLSRLVPRFVGENLKPGDTLEDAAILSTTKNPKESGTKNMFHRSVINKLRGSYAETYGESEPTKVGWTVYEIETPKGTKAIDMEKIGELDEEGEVLLPPNTKLEVVSVEDRPEPDFPQAADSIFKAYTVKLRIVPVSENDNVEPDSAEQAQQYQLDSRTLDKFNVDIETADSIEEIREAEAKRKDWLETNGVTVKEIGGSNLVTFTPEEIQKAYNYRPEGGIYEAENMTEEQGKEFNRRMRTLADLKRPGSISDETIKGQNELNRKNDGDTAALIEVKELRHSAPASRFNDITTNGITPKATNKVGSENYTRRRFGVFLANGYTSSEAGEKADVFRVKVPENDLRVDAGYARYGDNLYIERTIKPEELEHIGHYPVSDSAFSQGLHSGRGAECAECALAEKEREERGKAREKEQEEKYSTPALIYQLKFADGSGLAPQHAVRYKSGADELHTDHSIEDCPETSKNPGVVLRPNGIGEDETIAEIVEAAESATEEKTPDWEPKEGLTTGKGDSQLLDTLVDGDYLDIDAIEDGDVPRNFEKYDLSDEQDSALKNYASGQYRRYNNLLRYGPEDMDPEKVKDIQEKINSLDEIIDTYGDIDNETFVFRGMAELPKIEDTDVTMTEMLESLNPGDVFSDPGFTSTSSNKDIALRQFGPGIGLDSGATVKASEGSMRNSSFWTVRLPSGSKALGIPKAGYGYASAEDEVILPRDAKLKIDAIRKVPQVDEDGEENGNFNYYVEATVQPQAVLDRDPITGLETATEKKERIKPGFKNWINQVKKIFDNWDNDLVGDADNSSGDAGNTLQANFIEQAGFNEKPKVLSQEEFDAIEAETVYRGHTSSSFADNYINSELQFSGEGYFGNGTYTSNKRGTAEAYTGKDGYGDPTKDEVDERILEMKLLPDANVLSFEEVTELREWADEKTREFLDTYEKAGANPAEYQDAEWRLFNEADWTNIAIMLGIDAVRFKVPLTDNEEYYTIILNRGKVAINGKSRTK